MVEIFVATSAQARVSPLTKEVQIDFGNAALKEIAIQLPVANLQILAQQAADRISSSTPKPRSDALPLGRKYGTTGHVLSRTQSGVRLAIHVDSDTGHREVYLDLSPRDASLLADDIYDKLKQA